MGQCIYCQESAGFLRRRHKACQATHDEGVARIVATVADAAIDPSEAVSAIQTLASRHRVRDAHLEGAIERAWARCVEAHLRKSGVDHGEEARLDAILAAFGKSRQDIDTRGLWRQVGQSRADHARCRIAALVREAMQDARGLDLIDADIQSAVRNADLPESDQGDLLVRCLETEVDRVLDDDLLTKEEERAVVAVAGHFGLDSTDLDRNGAWTRLVKAEVLRDLTEGIPSQRGGFDRRSVPFRLQKSETLIWVFDNVDYSTVKTRREFQGRTAGVSVRVAKGVYFRTGGFSGHPVEVEETVHVDTGLLGVTTRHLYFAGAAKSFRVRHDRMVTIEPYSDAVGIMRDTARAKPETFRLGDGWFAYNLLRNLEYLDT